jgi:hypothetical protein
MSAVATRLDVAEARKLRDSGGLLSNLALRAIEEDDKRVTREADEARLQKRREEEAPAALAEAKIAADNYAKAQAEHLDACQAIINSAERLNTKRAAWESHARRLRGLKIEPDQYPEAPRKIELSSNGRALLREARNSVEVNG